MAVVVPTRRRDVEDDIPVLDCIAATINDDDYDSTGTGIFTAVVQTSTTIVQQAKCKDKQRQQRQKTTPGCFL
jgi:hypothetical protein